ncbi:MAG: class II aldolase/adducin family protein [Lysobacterales bacterium]|jgi:L-fuculose-phosphate aldolase
MSEEQRRALIEAALDMNRSGLNTGTSGNLSVRAEGGMLITPSALRYEQMQLDDIVSVKDDGTGAGRRRPSSEWRIHRDVYAARPDASAILHAHPAACAALACLRRPIPAFHYMVAVAGGRDIRCSEYATFGTQALSDHVLSALEDRMACLMGNHGLICLGPDLNAVLALAIEIEHLAAIYLKCLAVGEPPILPDDEMDRVLEKFADYRQP